MKWREWPIKMFAKQNSLNRISWVRPNTIQARVFEYFFFFLCLGQSVIINSLHCLWVWGCFFLSLSVRSTSQPSLSSLSTLNNESTFKYYCQQIHIFSSHYRTFSLQINVKYLYRICLKLIRCETLLRNCVSIDHRWIQYHHHL